VWSNEGTSSHVPYYCDSESGGRKISILSDTLSLLSCYATKLRCVRLYTVGSPSLAMLRSLTVLFLLLPTVLSATSPTIEVQDGQTGTLIVVPPQATETGLKRIPGKFHASFERIFLNYTTRCCPPIHCTRSK
jgi:hypothetical protein